MNTCKNCLFWSRFKDTIFGKCNNKNIYIDVFENDTDHQKKGCYFNQLEKSFFRPCEEFGCIHFEEFEIYN